METVTGIGFKKKDRWRRVASSIALVVKLTAMLEAWWVDVVGSNQPGYSTPIYPLKFFLFFYLLYLFFNCNLTRKWGKSGKTVVWSVSINFPVFLLTYDKFKGRSTKKLWLDYTHVYFVSLRMILTCFKEQFNTTVIAKPRVTFEHTIGMLKSRFCMLWSICISIRITADTPSFEKVLKYVRVAIILHNLLIRWEDRDEECCDQIEDDVTFQTVVTVDNA